MHIIEPCCAKRHLLSLRNAIRRGGTTDFEGYGDLSLAELLPALLTRYCETEMMIVAPSLPDQAAEAVAVWMRRQRMRSDGKGKLDYIRHLTVVASLSRRKSPIASMWKRENPFGERLTLVGRQQEDTAILLPDFVITGPVNMRYGEHFTATATTDPERVAALWRKYTALAAAGEEQEPQEEEKPQEKIQAPEIPEPVGDAVAGDAVTADDAASGE